MARLELGGVTLEVVRKDVRNVHLSVYPPTGTVRIAAPSRMKLETIRLFAITKLGWIRKQQRKLRAQQRETAREYLDRESHYVWGRRLLLTLNPVAGSPAVQTKHGALLLSVPSSSSASKKQAVLDEWYREQVKVAVGSLVEKWECRLDVNVDRVYVQRMKTKWGSCNPGRASIRLNSELAKKPRQCLEYIVVHEMMHLLEPTHSRRFVRLLDTFMPRWQSVRDTLNQLPVRHETWGE